MIKISFSFRGERAFIHCSENKKEKEELKTLVAETEIIHRLLDGQGKTGLWILDKMIIGQQFAVATNLCSFQPSDLHDVRQTILRILEVNHRKKA